MVAGRWVSGLVLCVIGMPAFAGCGGNSSENSGGAPGGGGQSLGMAGNAGAGAGNAGASGAGAMFGSGGSAGASSNAGAPGAAGTPGTAGSSACTDLVNLAPAIEETYVSGAPPAPTGGAVQDGTYFETAFVNYAAAAVTPAPTHRFTARVTGNQFEAVYSDTNVSEGAEQRITFTFTTSGSDLNGTRTCLNGNVTPSPVTFSGYDATPTTITLHLPLVNHASGATYTLSKH